MHLAYITTTDRGATDRLLTQEICAADWLDPSIVDIVRDLFLTSIVSSVIMNSCPRAYKPDVRAEQGFSLVDDRDGPICKTASLVPVDGCGFEGFDGDVR